jgi:hypothetical protein
MTYDSKTDALNVQTNIHIALRHLREGKTRVVSQLRAFINSDGQIDAFNESYRELSCFAREWHQDLQGRFRLHPAVDKLLADYRPLDWQQLVLEFPHQAESDRNRVAYTQNERKGMDNIQTVTSLGKYLTRHFPQLPDHEIRNTVASYSVVGCKIVYTIAEMINALQRGPHSCMRWGDGTNIDIDTHPYKVYDPRLGWGMAVREEGGEIIGRALVYERDDIKKFVRTYQRPSIASSYSQADDNLNAWLRDQGYEHASDWEGCLMRHYDGREGRPLAPYLDGGMKNVDAIVREGNKYLIVTEGGEYRFEQTDGTCYSNSDSDTCNDCGDNIDDGDGYWVGADEDEIVCQSCCDNNYYYGYGRRGRQYYIHESNIVSVGDETYDESYLGDNEIVSLHDGEYAHQDDAVYIESQGEYYEADSDDICYDDYNQQYELRDNLVELVDGSMCHSDDAWQCWASDGWYSDNDSDDRVEIDTRTYHKDHAPVECDDEETTETTGE